MAYKDNAETLSVDIEKTVYAAFQKQYKERRQLRNAAAEAAIKIWIQLPVEIQARLIDQSIDANYFVEVVEGIVEKKIEEGRQAAKKLLGRHNKKPTQKG